MEKRHIIMIGLIIFFTIYISVIFFSFESVTKKLERTCNLYDMEYVYRNGGQYCIEDDGKIYPIATDCPSPIKRGTCDIKFIKYLTED